MQRPRIFRRADKRAKRNSPSSRLFAGMFVVLALVTGAAAAEADSASARLKAETDALNADLRSLEGRMRALPAPSKPAKDKERAGGDAPALFQDKQLHLGGVALTPGGFLAIEGLRHQ